MPQLTTPLKVEYTPSKAEVLSQMGTSTIAFVAKRGENYRPYCTGVWVSQTKILTAEHCVEAAARMAAMETEDETEINPLGINMFYTLENEVGHVGETPNGLHLSKAIALDRAHDLAVVEALGKAIPRHTFAKIVQQTPAIGDKIYIVGHPSGWYWTYIEGMVSAHRDEVPKSNLKIRGPFLQVMAPVYFGNSGGGAFNDKGELVGIASFITRSPNMGFFIDSVSIIKFLKSL